MADNVTTPAPDGTKLAFDEVTIGGQLVKVGRNKIGHGADGEYNEVSESSPLPVSLPDAPLTHLELLSEAVPVEIESLPLPEGAATAIKQDEAKASIEKLGSARIFFAITPADANLTRKPDAIHVTGNDGVLVLRDAEGTDTTIPVKSDGIYPYSPTQVRTGTTATGLIGLLA